MHAAPKIVGSFSAAPGTHCHMSTGRYWASDIVLGWALDDQGKLHPITYKLPKPWTNPRYAIEMPDGNVHFDGHDYETVDQFKVCVSL